MKRVEIREKRADGRFVLRYQEQGFGAEILAADP
jgi:hypothetical protein